jgi:hypothetical protein
VTRSVGDQGIAVQPERTTRRVDKVGVRPENAQSVSQAENDDGVESLAAHGPGVSGSRYLSPNGLPVNSRAVILDRMTVFTRITKLAADGTTAAEVVRQGYYAGLSFEEVGDRFGIPRANANRHWTYGLAWLRFALQDGDSAPST